MIKLNFVWGQDLFEVVFFSACFIHLSDFIGIYISRNIFLGIFTLTKAVSNRRPFSVSNFLVFDLDLQYQLHFSRFLL